ncbi:MAG: SDR family oxidoreductase [Anaerolineae bacterium]|nr:SDR family oxidoreductase [Anaerolineae bacterium]
MMSRFSGKVAVVTGAARGIGQAIALRFAEEKARVAVLDIVDRSDTVSACCKFGVECVDLEVDVASRDSIEFAVQTVVGRWGRLDIWVNNAGIFDLTPVAALSDERWEKMVHVNVRSMFWCARAVVPQMEKQGWGRIINISSMAGKIAFADEIAYCTTKTAVLGLTRALAVELGAKGITANAICPGPIETDMLRHTYQTLADQNRVSLEEWRENVRRTIPVGRFGKPDEVAALAAFLASDEAGFINGQAINIDGGMVFY